MNKLILFILICTKAVSGLSQNYDADSVQYTPIAKPGSNVNRSKGKTALTNSPEYFFMLQTGMLVGCNDCGKSKDYTFSVAAAQGVTMGRKFRAGVGFGFDSYQNWQTLPLFGMASWDLIGNRNKNALFVQLGYGWSHPWFVRDGVYSGYTTDPYSGVKGGRMINPQIGYRIKYYNLKLSMAVGYKYQQIFYKKPYYYYPNCPTCDFPQISFDEITQEMNRVQLVVTVGWK